MRLSIRNKLMFGFGIITGLVIVSFFILFLNLGKNRKISEKINNQYIPSVEKLNKLNNMVNNSKMLMKNWVYIDKKENTPDKLRLKKLQNEDYSLLRSELDTLKKDWKNEDTLLLNNILQTIEDTLFLANTSIMSKLNSFESYEDAMIIMEINMLVESGSALMNIYDKTFEQLNELLSNIQEEANTANDEMLKSFNGFRLFIIILGIGLVILSLAIAMYTTSSITQPLNKLKQLILKMRKGQFNDLNIKHSKDEIGDMSHALEDLIIKLRETIGSIIKGAESLAVNSEKISEASKEVAEGASIQSNLAADVTASMEEMVANIQQNSDNAMQTEGIAVKASDDITKSSDAVDTTVSSMQEIAKKIAIIGEIAQQTNILAINAAVESARAGVYGKGFAVVADQVKKLAESSQKAADEINKLSKSSVEIAQTSGALLHEIVPNIQKTSTLVQEITSASEEQKIGAEQVNNAVIKLNNIIRTNEDQAQSMASSSLNILDQAESLKEIVSFFEL